MTQRTDLTTRPSPATRPARRLTRRASAEAVVALLEFQSPTAALVETAVPASARNTVWVVASLVGACVGAMALVPIDQVVTASGKLVAMAPTMVVQPLETAIVRSIDVREGQVVHAGDVLARLDPTFAAADMGSLEEQVTSLGAEVERLRDEIAGKPYRPAAANAATQLQLAIYGQRAAENSFKLENYQQKIDSLKAAAQRAASDVQGYQERLKVAAELEKKRVELEKLQVGSQINRLAATDNRLEIARGLSSAQATLQGALRDLQAMAAERDGYIQQWRAEASQTLTDQGRKLSDAQEQLNKAKLRRQLVDLRAEQDAVVLTVAKLSVGSVLQTGDQFITLVPVNAPLEVEANISASEAGYVHPGNTATLKFDTFPFIHYGYAEGTVRSVSADSFTANQAGDQKSSSTSSSTLGGPNQVFYRARVTLDTVKLHDTPAGFKLTPGMPVTSDIKVGTRTVLTYLFGRMLAPATEGMREP